MFLTQSVYRHELFHATVFVLARILESPKYMKAFYTTDVVNGYETPADLARQFVLGRLTYIPAPKELENASYGYWRWKDVEIDSLPDGYLEYFLRDVVMYLLAVYYQDELKEWLSNGNKTQDAARYVECWIVHHEGKLPKDIEEAVLWGEACKQKEWKS